MGIAALAFSLAASVVAPAAQADPSVGLPPIATTGAGPIIGGGDDAEQARIARQLSNLDEPDIQEGDGSDAAAFIGAAASTKNSALSSAFVPLQRALGCQKDNTPFGARAYRRADGQWGGAMLVIAQSATTNLDALTACIKSSWPAPSPAGTTSMCTSGWTYPTSGENHRPETYYVLLAGTAGDFCAVLNESYGNFATPWP
ncbi:hypothetical protein [Mycobacterium sp. 1423905.2]|uniref:hypothetical protein n=1 Tax=Mycobacterium sp. 1423905.2 TaxID=1856859 RepID=UPI0007FBECE8|nr:hypothetical protein [Mycobacterium sp. 1423905.2]OBJ54812.1 hypothetical protein A9W95_16350 [Mycobacterium sp. 1423905.2]